MRLMLLPTHVHVSYFFAVAFVTVIIVLVALFAAVVVAAVISTFFWCSIDVFIWSVATVAWFVVTIIYPTAIIAVIE